MASKETPDGRRAPDYKLDRFDDIRKGLDKMAAKRKATDNKPSNKPKRSEEDDLIRSLRAARRIGKEKSPESIRNARKQLEKMAANKRKTTERKATGREAAAERKAKAAAGREAAAERKAKAAAERKKMREQAQKRANMRAKKTATKKVARTRSSTKK